LPGKLKKDHAYLSRYGRNEEKKKELETLYKEKDFASANDEEINVSKVKALRKHLATFNRPDLLFELKQEIEKGSKKKPSVLEAPMKQITS
jgi:hypothetical protein